MTTISAQIIADSVGVEDSPRLTTVLWRYPRWIHAEGRTHRRLRIGEQEIVDFEDEMSFPLYAYDARTPSVMEDEHFSRNASSSRAIPVSKLIEDIIADPAIPLFWGANQRGMQADLECNQEITGIGFDDSKPHSREEAWLMAMMQAVKMARAFNAAGYHKQIVNRLLEPFSHITVVVTATRWSNFFALRRHVAAEPHIKLLADATWRVMNASIPRQLKPGEWHLPFVGETDWSHAVAGRDTLNLLKLSVARCASTSYKTVDGFDMTMDRAILLHDRLVAETPIHASPCEHQAKVDIGHRVGHDEDFYTQWSNPHLSGNLDHGWVQYRKVLPGEEQ